MHYIPTYTHPRRRRLLLVYGVLTEDFNIEGGLSLIRNKLEMFNNGLRLTTDLIWLSPDAKRRERQGASILITF
jgi:hypothetical protein